MMILHTLPRVSRLDSSTSIDAVYSTQLTNRNCVAALAVLLYDIIVTTDEEVALIWPSTLSPVKLLYLFIRYFPVAVLISVLFVGTELSPIFHFTPHDCYIWQVWQGVSTVAINMAVDIILVLRTVRVMYSRHRKAMIAVSLAFMLEVCVMVVCLIITVPGIQYDAICSVTFIPSSILIYGGAALLFQLILFVLTMAEFIKSLRYGVRMRVMTLLARDGTWAFILIFLVMIGQASLGALPEKQRGRSGVLFGWLLAIFSFSGYRILLNFRRITTSPEQSVPDLEIPLGEVLEFNRNPHARLRSYERSDETSYQPQERDLGGHS